VVAAFSDAPLVLFPAVQTTVGVAVVVAVETHRASSFDFAIDHFHCFVVVIEVVVAFTVFATSLAVETIAIASGYHDQYVS